jgi:peptide/nickel transport system permease protein
MISFLGKRLIVAVSVTLVITFLTFLLLFVSGDPATALAGASSRGEDVEKIRALYGLDRPILVQYAEWLWKAARGDLGESLFFQLPVVDLLAGRLPVTLTVGVLAMGLALTIGVPLGMVAAVRRGGAIDRFALVLAVVGQAMPTFWFGLILIVVFGMMFPVLPISGADDWRGYILPVIVLGYYATPAIMRLVRSGMIDALQSDYIRTARANGLLGHTILLDHALRNAIIPLVSLTAVQFGYLLSGSIVVESVFALNGLGRLGWESIIRSDLPTVQAIILVLSAIFILLTTCADVLTAWIDPRARMQ